MEVAYKYIDSWKEEIRHDGVVLEAVARRVLSRILSEIAMPWQLALQGSSRHT